MDQNLSIKEHLGKKIMGRWVTVLVVPFVERLEQQYLLHKLVQKLLAKFPLIQGQMFWMMLSQGKDLKKLQNLEFIKQQRKQGGKL